MLRVLSNVECGQMKTDRRRQPTNPTDTMSGAVRAKVEGSGTGSTVSSSLNAYMLCSSADGVELFAGYTFHALSVVFAPCPSFAPNQSGLEMNFPTVIALLASPSGQIHQSSSISLS